MHVVEAVRGDQVEHEAVQQRRPAHLVHNGLDDGGVGVAEQRSSVATAVQVLDAVGIYHSGASRGATGELFDSHDGNLSWAARPGGPLGEVASGPWFPQVIRMRRPVGSREA
ncbi:hypothetical protein BBK82_16640 [Lentzea guizhouensis]|uniref:Uncharacterized protein n=1 Tax=Lentzea guizhouensis TaxID=1586287 RepID=A0A1B2HIB6_9PSEU|nr:hypothetical protein BBK82_16640 [Lentzea guizhouensis]